jgi:adenylate cyclase
VSEGKIQRRLAAVLAADIVGYSKLMEADEAGTRARVRMLNADIIDPMVAADGGRIVKTTGDGILIEFPSAVDAVRNALAVQEALAGANAGTARDTRIDIRVGINVGDLIIEGDDIYGDGVNIAARLEGLCEPGQVFVSSSVYEHVQGKLPVAFDDLGEQTLKNIKRRVRVYRVRSGENLHQGSTTGIDADQPEISAAAKPSIVILPFSNMSGDQEQEYFSDGITEDIITALSHIRQIFVVARNTSFTFKNKAVDIQTVAKELRVRYVLEGSVRKSGKRVRITAQLIDAPTGTHLWAERYDRELADIFDIQDDVTQAVAGAIAPELGRAEQQRALAKPTDSLDAWDIYQRGMFHLYKRTADDNRTALSLLQKAIDLDPTFAPPYGSIARTQVADYLLGYVEHDPRDIVQNGQRAVELDDQDAKSHYALGIAQVMAMRDGQAALRSFEDGRRINPDDADILNGLGKALTCIGQAEEAIERAEQAIKLSPSDQNIGLFYGTMALAQLCVGRLEEAVHFGRLAQRKTPSWIEWIALPAALALLDRVDEANETCRRLVKGRPELTLSFVAEHAPLAYQPYLDILLDGLRKAGLDE